MLHNASPPMPRAQSLPLVLYDKGNSAAQVHPAAINGLSEIVASFSTLELTGEESFLRAHVWPATTLAPRLKPSPGRCARGRAGGGPASDAQVIAVYYLDLLPCTLTPDTTTPPYRLSALGQRGLRI